MIRHLIRALLAALAAAGPASTTAPAQTLRQERVSSWRTTTHIELAPLRRPDLPGMPTLPVITGSLPLAPRLARLPPSPLTGGHQLDGLASFYWQEQKTATGEQFDKMAMTAAHKTLPFGTRVRVTNVTNQRAVVVRINDRGPFKPGRVIDLSYAAAGILGMHDRGLAPVRIEVVK